MRATLRFGDSAGAVDIFDFADWLRNTPAVTRSIDVELRTEQSPEGMSAGDVIVLAATAVSALSSVVSAYAAWKAMRGSAPTLIVTVDGRSPLEIREGLAVELKPLELPGPDGNGSGSVLDGSDGDNVG
jgi:hypothetical protein